MTLLENRPAESPSDVLRRGIRPQGPMTFVCWKWKQRNFRTEYTAHHVNVWARGIRANYLRPCRLICVTDDPEGITECETYPLWSDHADLKNPSGPHLPSCYRRLKIFSRLTTAEMDVEEGDFVTSTDLDVVFTANLEALLHKFSDASFVGWKGVGAHRPTVYNGSLFRFRAGSVDFLWRDFDPKTSPRTAIENKYFGSDQSWLSYRLNGAAPGWGVADGVLSYTSNLGQRSMLSGGQRRVLPATARIVSFNGKRKPWEASVQEASPWIKKFWRLDL